MISLSEVDSASYLEELTERDGERFEEVYGEKWEELSEDKAEDRVKAELRNRVDPCHEVFEAVVDAFHPSNEDGVNTGYEVGLTNPLYEVEENAADLLLASNDYQEIHFCFIITEVGGEHYSKWAQRVNYLYDLFNENDQYLLSQMPESDLEIGHVQYVTVTRKEDVPDVKLGRLIKSVVPDKYGLLVVDDDYSGPGAQVQLYLEHGEIAHRKLRSQLEDGIDYGDGENYEISCPTHGHDFICLREILMSLMLSQYGADVEEPREFNYQDFEDKLVDQTHIDDPPEEKSDSIEERSVELLSIAFDADMVHRAPHRRINSNRDYRLRFPSGDPDQVPDYLEKKWIEYRGPFKRADDAFRMAKDSFKPQEPVKTELSDEDSWGKS